MLNRRRPEQKELAGRNVESAAAATRETCLPKNGAIVLAICSNRAEEISATSNRFSFLRRSRMEDIPQSLSASDSWEKIDISTVYTHLAELIRRRFSGSAEIADAFF